MKYYLDGVLVVEGSSDEAFLSSFLDTIYVKTNGYDVPPEEIDFLKHVNKPIYVFSDPDNAGKTIRDRIHNFIGKCIDVEVDIEQCNKHGKSGIAECNKDEILRVLRPFFTEIDKNIIKYNLNTLIALGVDSLSKRQAFCESLHLGKCNNKTIIKRLNYLNVNFDQIKRTAELINDNKQN